jgi:hypothetical protein
LLTPWHNKDNRIASEFQTRHLSSLDKRHSDLLMPLNRRFPVQRPCQQWGYPIFPAMATNHCGAKVLDPMGRGGQSHTTTSTYLREFSRLFLHLLFHIHWVSLVHQFHQAFFPQWAMTVHSAYCHGFRPSSRKHNGRWKMCVRYYSPRASQAHKPIDLRYQTTSPYSYLFGELTTYANT